MTAPQGGRLFTGNGRRPDLIKIITPDAIRCIEDLCSHPGQPSLTSWPMLVSIAPTRRAIGMMGLAVGAGVVARGGGGGGRLEWALGGIVFGAMLGGMDGRVGRMLKGTSRFGAELDSLADFVNFGVAPGLILYFWGLHELKSA